MRMVGIDEVCSPFHNRGIVGIIISSGVLVGGGRQGDSIRIDIGIGPSAKQEYEKGSRKTSAESDDD
jgi:hypothetical protein